MAILDTYSNVTAAWSMDRVLVGAYGGAKYNVATGVSSLNDQTGNARHLAQATAAAQPVVSTGGLQSRACANFDGTDDILIGPAFSNFITVSTGYFVFAALPIAVTTNSGNAHFNDAVFGDSSQACGLYFRSEPAAGAFLLSSSNRVTPEIMPIVNGPLYVLEWKHESGVLGFRANGETWLNVAAPNMNTVAGLIRIAATFSGAAVFTQLSLFEGVAFNVIPSVAQQNALVADMLAHYSAPKTYANKLLASAVYQQTNAIIDFVSVNKAIVSAVYQSQSFYLDDEVLRAGVPVVGLAPGIQPLLIRTTDAENIFIEEAVNIYVLEAGAPALYSQKAFPTSSTTADLAVTTTGTTGTIYWVVTPSKIQPTGAQIVAGQDETSAAAVASGSIAVGSSGEKTAVASGLPGGTCWAHFYQVAGDSKVSNVATCLRTDVVAPVVPILDEYGANITSAWSLSRDLVSGFGGSKYVDIAGEITTITNQKAVAARNFTDAAAATRRPALATASPNSRACADFGGAGSGDGLVTTSIASNHVSASSGFMAVSVIIDAFTLNPVNCFDSDCILGDALKYLGLFGTTNGGGTIFGYNWDSNKDESFGYLAPATPAVLHWRHHNGLVYLGINGAERSAPSGNTFNLNGALNLGSIGGSAQNSNMKFFEGFTSSDGSHPYDNAISAMMTHIGA